MQKNKATRNIEGNVLQIPNDKTNFLAKKCILQIQIFIDFVYVCDYFSLLYIFIWEYLLSSDVFLKWWFEVSLSMTMKVRWKRGVFDDNIDDSFDNYYLSSIVDIHTPMHRLLSPSSIRNEHERQTSTRHRQTAQPSSFLTTHISFCVDSETRGRFIDGQSQRAYIYI